MATDPLANPDPAPTKAEARPHWSAPLVLSVVAVIVAVGAFAVALDANSGHNQTAPAYSYLQPGGPVLFGRCVAANAATKRCYYLSPGSRTSLPGARTGGGKRIVVLPNAVSPIAPNGPASSSPAQTAPTGANGARGTVNAAGAASGSTGTAGAGAAASASSLYGDSSG